MSILLVFQFHEFVVGYGLDFQSDLENLDHVAVFVPFGRRCPLFKPYRFQSSLPSDHTLKPEYAMALSTVQVKLR